jgi:hypothetical protein
LRAAATGGSSCPTAANHHERKVPIRRIGATPFRIRFSNSRSGMHPRCRGATRPSFTSSCATESMRARGMPGARGTRSPCAAKNAHGSHYRYSGTPGISLRNGFSAYALLSPATNSSCHRRRRIWLVEPGWARNTSADLTPATGARTTRFCRTRPAFAKRLQPACAHPAEHWRKTESSAVRSRARSSLTGLAAGPAPASRDGTAAPTASLRPLCPQNLPECANGRFSQNRPSLELSPLRPKGGRACHQSEGQLRWSSSTRIVARASSPNRARKGVDDGTKRSRCRRH